MSSLSEICHCSCRSVSARRVERSCYVQCPWPCLVWGNQCMSWRNRCVSLKLASAGVVCCALRGHWYHRMRRLPCKVNAIVTCFPMAPSKGTEVPFSSSPFNHFFISGRKVKGSRYFCFIRKGNGRSFLVAPSDQSQCLWGSLAELKQD